jgi:hypothetical protein
VGNNEEDARIGELERLFTVQALTAEVLDGCIHSSFNALCFLQFMHNCQQQQKSTPPSRIVAMGTLHGLLLMSKHIYRIWFGWWTAAVNMPV